MALDKISFLLVDDLDANLMALEGLLKRDGLNLIKANSGTEALEVLFTEEISLAFLDVQMPGMSGFELAETMRGSARTRHIPIIFLTAGAVDQQRRFEGYEMGAVDFLFKPIEPHILQSKADVFFELARQRNELKKTSEARAELVEALRVAQSELRQYSNGLEKTVEERTAKLRETISELEHFSYTITHDMRAPLRAMHGLCQILEEECGSKIDETGRDYLRRITRSASRMDHLIVDALNYSKTVRTEMELGPINPGPLLREIVESYPQFQPPKVRIELSNEFHTVIANRAGLTQAFSNLLGNGVKFVPTGRTPTIRVFDQVDGNRARICFEDNGVGVPTDQYSRIFQMFYRLDNDFEGTGVGLALVKKVVERMRGTVGVESVVGTGSRFWIDLERAE
jgi:signal transduction histidine kinase